MISYIFKNKTKNILAIVFTTMYIAISFYSIVASALRARAFSCQEILVLLPYVMILMYLLTLERQYVFKEFLFPSAFVIRIILLVYISISSTVNFLKTMDSVEGIGTLVYSIVCNIILLVALVFCAIGSMFNFKKARFLKFGTLILIIMCVVNLILQVVSLVDTIVYFQGGELGDAILTAFVYTNVTSIISTVALMLFYFGIFNLTLNRDSENKCDCGHKK